jgi:hypothetical protein
MTLFEPGSQRSRVLLAFGSVGDESPSTIDSDVLSVEPLVLHHVDDGVDDLIGRYRRPRESGVSGQVVLAKSEKKEG